MSQHRGVISLPLLASRRLRAATRTAAALVLTALLSLGTMAAYLGDRIYQNGDLWNNLGGVVEGRNALAEGQFPIRVAPHQLDGQRYPVFQFYGNLPYTVGGMILGEEGRNPYAALKWTLFAALMVGGMSVWGIGWRWTRSQPAALSSVAVFLSAPYLMTNLNDRGALAEAIAISLLPAALLATWTCMIRRGPWRVAVCAVAWTALGLTHNITYLYGAAFLGAFIVSFVRPRPRSVRRIGRLALAGMLHLALVAWYLAPQITLMPHLAISTGLATPTWSAVLTPLKVLLWPVCRTPEVSTIPRLGLQAGWVVIAGVLAGIAPLLVNAHPRRSCEQAVGLRSRLALLRGLSGRLLVLWVIAFFLAWSPVDIWSLVPKIFNFVQFTYRLLGFVLLLGALLAAVGIAGFRRRRGGRGRWLVFGVVGVAAALTQAAYYPDGRYHPRGAHRWINDRPQFGGLGDYLLRPRGEPPLPAGMDRVVIPPQPLAEDDRRTNAAPLPVFRAQVPRPTRIVLPVLWYPQMLEVEVNGRPIDYGVSDRRATVDLPPGQHLVVARFVGLPWANQISAGGALIVLGILGWAMGGRLRGRRR